jgi:hypothetical protein
MLRVFSLENGMDAFCSPTCCSMSSLQEGNIAATEAVNDSRWRETGRKQQERKITGNGDCSAQQRKAEGSAGQEDERSLRHYIQFWFTF